jgi:leader peptidase (prepilin peptidase)/N-methyltransferase
MFWFLAIILLGWLVGGLVNYLSDYLPFDRKPVLPYCLGCKKPVGIIACFIKPTMCNNCGRKPGWRWYIVGVFYTALAVWLWRVPHAELNFFVSLLVCIYFGVVVVVDFEHRLILHPVSAVGAVLGLLVGIELHGIVATLIGGLAGFLLMTLLYQGGRLFLRVLARWRNYTNVDEALGFGDVILAGVLGLLLGWPGITVGLVLAILLAGVFGLIYLIFLFITHRYQANVTIAYGPYLVASAFILLFLNEPFARLF